MKNFLMPCVSVTFCCLVAEGGGRKSSHEAPELLGGADAFLFPSAVFDCAGSVAAGAAGAGAAAAGTGAGASSGGGAATCCSPSAASSFSTLEGSVAHSSGSKPITRLAALTMGSAPTMFSGRPSAALIAATRSSIDDPASCKSSVSISSPRGRGESTCPQGYHSAGVISRAAHTGRRFS